MRERTCGWEEAQISIHASKLSVKDPERDKEKKSWKKKWEKKMWKNGNMILAVLLTAIKGELPRLKIPRN